MKRGMHQMRLLPCHSLVVVVVVVVVVDVAGRWKYFHPKYRNFCRLKDGQTDGQNFL